MAQGERIWPRRGDRSYRNTFTPERSRNQKFKWRHTSDKWSRSAPVPYPSLLRQGEGGILRTESSRFASSAEEVLGVLKATWFGGVSVLFGVEFVLHWPLRLVEAIMANNADLFSKFAKENPVFWFENWNVNLSNCRASKGTCRKTQVLQSKNLLRNWFRDGKIYLKYIAVLSKYILKEIVLEKRCFQSVLYVETLTDTLENPAFKFSR